MAKPWEHHNQIVVESYQARKSGSKGEVRGRPIEGQMFPTDMQVQFSRQARNQHAVGTKFRIWVKESDIKGKGEFLQSPWQWPYEVVE
jgi:hypothetical protein